MKKTEKAEEAERLEEADDMEDEEVSSAPIEYKVLSNGEKVYASYLDQYRAEISPEAIPLYCVMGNEILYGEFDGNPEKVYKYCIEHKKKWEEVLNFEYDPTVLY